MAQIITPQLYAVKIYIYIYSDIATPSDFGRQNVLFGSKRMENGFFCVKSSAPKFGRTFFALKEATVHIHATKSVNSFRKDENIENVSINLMD